MTRNYILLCLTPASETKKNQNKLLSTVHMITILYCVGTIAVEFVKSVVECCTFAKSV